MEFIGSIQSEGREKKVSDMGRGRVGRDFQGTRRVFSTNEKNPSSLQKFYFGIRPERVFS